MASGAQQPAMEVPEAWRKAVSPQAQFFVPAAASLMERRPRTLKHGDTFALFDHNGDVIAGAGSPEGLYHRDTRHLSHLFLTVDGFRPLLLSSTLRDDNATLTCDLTNPDMTDADGNLYLAHDLIHIRRSRFLWNSTCFERISIRNFDEVRRRLSIEIAFAADFADLFEVRGAKRKRRGEMHVAEIAAEEVSLAYTGLDGRRRETRLHFDPQPLRLTDRAAAFILNLEPRRARSVFIEMRCAVDGTAALGPTYFSAAHDARRALRRASSRAASIETSNEIFNEAIRRVVSDLYMLMTDTPEGPYPYAGIPWFSTVFGRDALITALQTLWIDPAIARGVLAHLAANQATETDPASEAEPGKILHEVRQGEMAELGEVPFRRYYGSVDSTPLFVMLAGAYLERTGDVATLRKLWPNVEAALGWIEQSGDRDGDGFVEYFSRSPNGLINQGWRDSQDSVFHADGRLATGPIALVEVQAYVYGAWRAAAHICRAFGLGERAEVYADMAEALSKRFDEAFFDGELGTYVLALDGDKRPCRVRASNAGHALFTGIALPERAPQVARTLMANSSFSGWGIRTVATSEARYNPMSYHNGSVWPHDNAMIAAGLFRYDLRQEAARVFHALFAASIHVDLRRLPELYCGFPRQRNRGPTFYPVACSPQAWAAGAFLSLLQSTLGLAFNPLTRHVTFCRPYLPEFLDKVILRGLSVGGSRADVALTRAGEEVAVHVLKQQGDVSVLVLS